MEADMEAKDETQDSTCSVCKKKFKSAEKLSLHMGFHSLFGNFKKSPPSAEKNKPEVEDVAKSPDVTELKKASGKPRNKTADSVLLVEKPFRCTKCGVNFSSMRNKMQHDLLHTKKTTGMGQTGTYTTELKCSICKRRCLTERGLEKHFEIAHGDLSFGCEKCPKKFKTESLLKAHENDSHGDKDKQNEDAVEEPSKVTPAEETSKVRPKEETSKVSEHTYLKCTCECITIEQKNQRVEVYKCKECNQNCRTLKTFYSHVKKMHKAISRQSQPVTDEPVEVTCSECGKIFKDERCLKVHISNLHRKDFFRCLLCNSLFYHEVDLEKHNKSTHGKGKNYKCETCEGMFDKVAELRDHVAQTHNQKHLMRFHQQLRGYKRNQTVDKKTKKQIFGLECLICNKIFESTSHVMEHMEKEHAVKSVTPDSKNSKGVKKKVEKVAKEEILTSDSYENSKSKGLKRKNPNSDGIDGPKSVKKDKTEELEPIESYADELAADSSVQEAPMNTMADDPDSKQKAIKVNESFSAKTSPGNSKKKAKSFSWSKPKTKSQEVCRCWECDVVLDTEWDLEEHYKHKHSGTNYQVVPQYRSRDGKYFLYLKCLICGKMCRSKKLLRIHLKQHKNNKAVQEKTTVVEAKVEPVVEENEMGSTETTEGKQKRKKSCIYHCRACGKSFPRLYNYNEHTCSSKTKNCEPSQVDNGNGKYVKDENQEPSKSCLNDSGSNNNVGMREEVTTHNGEAEDQLESRGMKKTTSRKSIHKSIRERHSKSPEIRGNNKVTPKKNSKNITSAASSSNQMPNDQPLLKTQDKRKRCRYCKRTFTDPILLATHEVTHSEFSGYMCNKCGIGFSETHKLRYHQMRCNGAISPDASANTKRSSVTNHHEIQIHNKDVEDGFLEGKSYPSFATKKEYTVFDPANKWSHEDVNQNTDAFDDVMYDNNTSDYYDDVNDTDHPDREIASTGERPTIAPSNDAGRRQSFRQSGLDEIRIADVRSFHPSISANQYSTMVEQATGKAFPPEACSPQGPAYFFGPPGQAIPLQSGHQMNMMHHMSPPPNVYSNGTVFFVPYFVPAGEDPHKYFAKEFNNRSSFPPKQTGLDFGFNHRLNPGNFYQSPPPSYQAAHVPATGPEPRRSSERPGEGRYQWNTSNQNGDNRNCPSVSDRRPKSETERVFNAKETSNYECGVCQQKFETFGNFIKHRESHQ